MYMYNGRTCFTDHILLTSARNQPVIVRYGFTCPALPVRVQYVCMSMITGSDSLLSSRLIMHVFDVRFLLHVTSPTSSHPFCLSGEISTRVRRVTTQHEQRKTMRGMCDLKDNLDIQSCGKKRSNFTARERSFNSVAKEESKEIPVKNTNFKGWHKHTSKAVQRMQCKQNQTVKTVFFFLRVIRGSFIIHLTPVWSRKPSASVTTNLSLRNKWLEENE